MNNHVHVRLDYAETVYRYRVAPDGWVDGFPLSMGYKIRRTLYRLAKRAMRRKGNR